MTDVVGSSTRASNLAYWARREDELTRLANALYRGVEECKQHQATLIHLGETEKVGSEQWSTAMAAAGKSLRATRAIRTRFRKQIYAMRDTMRIRVHLAADAPPGLPQKLEDGVQYLGFLEAMGF